MLLVEFVRLGYGITCCYCCFVFVDYLIVWCWFTDFVLLFVCVDLFGYFGVVALMSIVYSFNSVAGAVFVRHFR